MRRTLTAVALAFGLSLALTACASAAEPVALGADAVIIDVRTPAEFATGHLDGALNIDVQSPDFDARMSQFDPAGEYFIYCRSGNRSAQAIARMTALGFSDLSDGGSVQEASTASGVPMVTP
jgi:phage shock protein E